MTGDCHARFCGSPEVRSLRATRPIQPCNRDDTTGLRNLFINGLPSMEGLARPAKSAEDPYRYLGRVHARNLAEVIAINLRRLGIRLVGELDIQVTGCIGPGSANSDWFIGSAPANYPRVHRTFASQTLPRPSLALYAFGRA